jgi:Calcineurin-like phosphoesterase
VLSRSRRFVITAQALSFFLAASLPAQQPAATSPTSAPKPPDKSSDLVIAVGDIHGAFDDFCQILKRAGLIDDQRHWSGGKATLVQVGDVIDRGAKGRQAMDLLMSLETEAPRAGGQLIPLLGNHEIMNILGDLRYVSAGDYSNYSDVDSEKRRKAAYQEYSVWLTANAEMLAALPGVTMPAGEQDWTNKHPYGFIEKREAFGPAGTYGKWIRSHAAVARIGDTVFLHGGITPNYSNSPIDQLNSQVHRELEDFDSGVDYLVSHKMILPFFTIQEIAVALEARLAADRAAKTKTDPKLVAIFEHVLGFGKWVSMAEDGPLWFRGYDQWTDKQGAPLVEKILAAYGAKHFVVAHTPQKNGRIRSRFGGRIFLIDTGMLASYFPSGRASALEIRDARKFTAEYVDSQEVLLDDKPLAAAPAQN